MITRDIVQGFIDGYNATGGDLAGLGDALSKYLLEHPIYPQPQDVVDVIITDLSSYRGGTASS